MQNKKLNVKGKMNCKKKPQIYILKKMIKKNVKN